MAALQGRRESFDTVADIYDKGRRDYPPEVVDQVVCAMGIGRGTRVLEIGCGTGRFSLHLARAGAELVAVELGQNLARIARDRLSRFSAAKVVRCAFEEWQLPVVPFDGVCAATAFHWLDPTTRFDKCAAALRPGGVIAIVHTHHVRGGTEDFFRTSNATYVRYGLSDEPSFEPPLAADIPPAYPELQVHPAFEGVRRRRIRAEIGFDTESHIAMLRTDSLVLALEEPFRSAFLAEIAEQIDSRYEGKVTRAFVYEIVTARRS